MKAAASARARVSLSTHETIDALFSSVIKTACIEDWSFCRGVSQTFSIALVVHLRHEESVQFPRYAATSNAAADEVDRLIEEHAAIRKAVEGLLEGLHEQRLRPEAVERVSTLLRDHDAHEAERFLPWLETFGRASRVTPHLHTHLR